MGDHTHYPQLLVQCGLVELRAKIPLPLDEKQKYKEQSAEIRLTYGMFGKLTGKLGCGIFQLQVLTGIPAAAPRRSIRTCRSSHYETLGVCPTSSDDEIKSAFRLHAKRWHPDINKAVCLVQ